MNLTFFSSSKLLPRQKTRQSALSRGRGGQWRTTPGGDAPLGRGGAGPPVGKGRWWTRLAEVSAWDGRHQTARARGEVGLGTRWQARRPALSSEQTQRLTSFARAWWPPAGVVSALPPETRPARPGLVGGWSRTRPGASAVLRAGPAAGPGRAGPGGAGRGPRASFPAAAPSEGRSRVSSRELRLAVASAVRKSWVPRREPRAAWGWGCGCGCGGQGGPPWGVGHSSLRLKHTAVVVGEATRGPEERAAGFAQGLPRRGRPWALAVGGRRLARAGAGLHCSWGQKP